MAIWQHRRCDRHILAAVDDRRRAVAAWSGGLLACALAIIGIVNNGVGTRLLRSPWFIAGVVLAGAAAVIFVAAGIPDVARWLRRATTSSPSVLISVPSADQTVPRKLIVQGTANCVPPSLTLWLVVQASQSMYPQASREVLGRLKDDRHGGLGRSGERPGRISRAAPAMADDQACWACWACRVGHYAQAIAGAGEQPAVVSAHRHEAGEVGGQWPHVPVMPSSSPVPARSGPGSSRSDARHDLLTLVTSSGQYAGSFVYGLGIA